MHFTKDRDDTVRLGAFKGRFGENITGRYIDHLVETFPAPVQHYDQVQCTVLYCTVLYCTVLCQVEDAVTVLRRSLAEAEDRSLVIASLGFLHNLHQLLQSPGDSLSPASGYELVRDKVDRYN